MDESMILFKGGSRVKQCNPKKPVKRGLKVWTIADNKVYIKKFRVYQGKDEILENCMLSEWLVLYLTEEEWGKGKRISNNYFTSIFLLERLKTESTLACSTVWITRKGIPTYLVINKKLNHGDFDYRISNTGISFLSGGTGTQKL